MPTDSGQATYLEAVGLALDHEMERDPDIFLIGEDVGQYGGAFKVTKGFLDKYGPRRVVDTPIAETGFTGLAAGAALVGLRPVVEFQFADFISCAFDPIINVLARHHWRTGDPMPVTMRAPFGGRLRAGPTHSQSVESYFAHVPGPQDRHAGHAAGRCRAVDLVDPGQQPDAVPGEQVPVPAAEGRRSAVDGPDPAGGGERGPGGQRRHADHLLGRRAPGPGDRRRAGQGRHLGRGRRRPDAGPAGRRDDRQLGEEDVPGGRAARGRDPDGLRRGDRRDHPGRGVLVPGPAGPADRREEHPDPDQSRRWRTR